MGATTHELTIGDREVVKRYRSWDRGEPDREWLGLTLLHEHRPGLAPEPLARRDVDGAPEVVMTRLPGVALGRGPLTHDQVDGLVTTVDRLHVADLVEHVSVRLPRLLDPDDVVARLGWTGGRAARLLGFRRMLAVFWLYMLLPGGRAHARNPAGSLEDQAAWTLRLLGDR